MSNYGNSQNIETGYSSPNDGGIYSSGFHTNDADFGNQYSAQNVQPSYGQQPQYGASGSGGGQAQYGGAQADDNIAMLEKAVPGVPGQDYPIYAEVRQYQSNLKKSNDDSTVASWQIWLNNSNFKFSK